MPLHWKYWGHWGFNTLPLSLPDGNLLVVGEDSEPQWITLVFYDRKTVFRKTVKTPGREM